MPCRKGLRPNHPEEGWLAAPGKVLGVCVGPGLLNGLLGDGLEGILGVEKLRLPRLPDELPPPALAHALDSRVIQNTKQREIKIPIATYSFFLVFISDCAPFLKVKWSSQPPHDRRMHPVPEGAVKITNAQTDGNRHRDRWGFDLASSG